MSSNEALLPNILRAVGLKFVFDTRVIEDEQINRHFIVVSIPQVYDPQLLIAARNVHDWPTETLRIVWTMTNPRSASGKEDWVSKDHLSTLTQGSMPETGASFAIQLIQDLQHKWILLCHNAEVHLSTTVMSTIALIDQQLSLIFWTLLACQSPREGRTRSYSDTYSPAGCKELG